MKTYEEVKQGMVLYTTDEEDFWDEESDSPNPNGKLPKHTQLKVESLNVDLLRLEIMEGQYKSKIQAVFWWGEGNAKPEDYLTEDEYTLIKGEYKVDADNLAATIEEIGRLLSGVAKEKYKVLINYLLTR